jgi:hypothetical protein
LGNKRSRGGKGEVGAKWACGGEERRGEAWRIVAGQHSEGWWWADLLVRSITTEMLVQVDRVAPKPLVSNSLRTVGRGAG